MVIGKEKKNKIILIPACGISPCSQRSIYVRPTEPVQGSDRHRCPRLFPSDHSPLPFSFESMPSKHHRPAALKRRSTSESNTKLTLSGLNLQRLDTSANLQLQVALNNATKDLPKGKGKKSTGQSDVSYDPFYLSILSL